MLQNKHTFILSFLVALLLSTCASKRAPGGGPIDKTAPKVISTFPNPDSIGVKELSVIKIEFSESISEASIANSVFISPPIEFNLEWQSDLDLEIQLKDSLKADQTYVIVIGSKVKDLRSNKLAESVQLAFSTGDQIDRGKISGRVFGMKKNQTFSLFAFELFSDTLSFVKNKPSYISQTGEKGKYLLNYLKLGNYRVFAVNDQNGNLLIDSDFEEIGIPYFDVFLDSTNSAFSNLNFKTTQIDTTTPKLTSIRPINSRQINLRFSERIFFNSLNQIEIRDSINSSIVSVLATSPNIEADNTLEIFTSPMDSGRVFLCSISSFSDSSMNMACDTIQSFVSGAYAEMDTFRIVTVSPGDSVWDAHPSVNFYFEVNNPLNKQTFVNNFLLTKQNMDTVEGHFQFQSAFEVEFIPKDKLILDTVYTLKIFNPKIKNVWGDTLTDSVLTRHIKISNGDDFGEVAGKVDAKGILSTKIMVKAQKKS